jgi:hypothetical protein
VTKSLAFVAALAALAIFPAQAADTIRVGKGNPTSFSFMAPHVGMEYGIFQKHNSSTSGFAGATRFTRR